MSSSREGWLQRDAEPAHLFHEGGPVDAEHQGRARLHAACQLHRLGYHLPLDVVDGTHHVDALRRDAGGGSLALQEKLAKS